MGSLRCQAGGCAMPPFSWGWTERIPLKSIAHALLQILSYAVFLFSLVALSIPYCIANGSRTGYVLLTVLDRVALS
jgi:hypothetical protein